MPVYLETYPVVARVDGRISRNREVLLHLAMECLERWYVSPCDPVCRSNNDSRRRPTMDAELPAPSSRDHSSLLTIHGFRVQSYGERISPGFKKGLRRLAARGFADPTCVVVKTRSGKRSGITHAGGRYVHRENAYSAEVMREMRALGMEPPSPPFLVAPGESTLYHEWGHHVDRTWSGDDQDVGFSFRWFSRFYQLLWVPVSLIGHTSRGLRTDEVAARPIESELEAASAIVQWQHAASELFANLFEDWMRGEKKVDWDECEPEKMNRSVSYGHPSVRIALLPQSHLEAIRAETYRFFTGGIRTPEERPPVRPDLFADYTDEIVNSLRTVIAMAKAKPG